MVSGMFVLSGVKNMELSRKYSTCHGYIQLVWGKEHGIVADIFDLSEVKNVELSRVCSICQK